MHRALHPARSTLRRATCAAPSRLVVASPPTSSLLAPTFHLVEPARAPALSPAPCRCFSTTRPIGQEPAAQYTIGDLTERQYHDLSNKTMDSLTEYLEEKLEDLDLPGLDVEYSSGVLTLKLGDKGTYVINKQPPNKQIWLSSPVSGPKRYDYDSAQRVWFYARDGTTMHDLLNTELRDKLGDEAIEVDLARDE
ncbi:uncharacterized protein RHOBADRAFT_65592 [Rhodotorula graminis WP1]|uniref:ferroxidase n=1 Tax=Rhodotorula graminis (strain WP1) TaxID=578459 RepID=A0A0P9GZ54_RHOGW|nr:uncharacterized protein RHOBADRAFT_65592 [Rhodotorula graminis WP1]KPV72675.1 hypothetical protein RHOBADRAFT_65592 [Rhodotorula graminis WP1]